MGEESRIVAQDCGSGTDWTHHAGAGQRPLSTQRRGAGVGGSVGHHPVVPAVVLSQPEPHRTTLEVHEASRPLRSLPPDFPGLSSRHPRGSRRFVNQVLPATGLVDDAEFPAIRRRLTHGRVRYMYQSGFSFTMNSGELYNLIKQEKIISVTDGVAPLDELSPSAQAEIEKFLRRIQGELEVAQDEPIADSRPGPEEPDERITLLD